MSTRTVLHALFLITTQWFPGSIFGHALLMVPSRPPGTGWMKRQHRVVLWVMIKTNATMAPTPAALIDKLTSCPPHRLLGSAKP